MVNDKFLIDNGWIKINQDKYHHEKIEKWPIYKWAVKNNKNNGFDFEAAKYWQNYWDEQKKRKKYHEENCKKFKIFKFLNKCFDCCKKCNEHGYY